MADLTRRSFVQAGALSAVGIACGGLLTSCQSASSPSSDAGEDMDASKVRVALNPISEPESGFDPLYGWGCGEAVHDPLIQSTLIYLDGNFTFSNDLATSYSASEDGLTWIFTIRDDVRFTNGQPLVAQDVAFTLAGVLASETSKVDLSALESAEALDSTTVVLHLSRPCGTILYSLAVIGIVPSDSYDAISYGTNPVGSGRYKLVKWERGKKVILKANSQYYGSHPSIQRIVIQFMGEEEACGACYNRQVDAAYTTPRLSSQSIEGYSLLDCSSIDCYGINLPTQPAGSTFVPMGGGEGVVASGNAVTCDLVVRQALNYGVDRKQLLQSAVAGYGSPAYGVGDGLPWECEGMRVDTDSSKAMQLLDEAGWVAETGNVRAKGSQRAVLELYYLDRNVVEQPVGAALANAFADQMRPLGIEVNTHAVGIWEMLSRSYTDPVLWEWGNATPAEVYDIYASDGMSNFSGYSTTTIDGYLAAADAATDMEAANALWSKAQWDGTAGVAPQGAATWVWLADIDHLFFKRMALDVGLQRVHTRSIGWSFLGNIDEWMWNTPE
jgi:peptide/nickel transport system substrate-binding protein